MKDYLKYFEGLKRNYGVCKTNEGFIDAETGKKRYPHEWSGTPVTNIDYEEHLKGNKSIGIQPCTDEGKARFGAIDVDKYPIDRQFYLKIIEEKNLPIIPVLSKSGGLHLYVFTTEFVKAKEIREFLEQVLFLFKLPINTEIFPKQTTLGENADGQKTNGNFLNLPYNNISRRALLPNGEEMDLDMFMKVVVANAQTKEQLKGINERIVKDELTGGDKEFDDGPPCLGILTKEVMKDGRDRFLYNYMVFAKKKYPDKWQEKIIEAARKYFEFDSNWTDIHVNAKVKSWSKDTKGHTCNDPLIAPVCVKAVCVKRKFGIISDNKPRWPMLSALQKLNIKPTPEWYFTIEKENGETKQIHAKNIHKIESQKELRAVIMEQAHVVPPQIKGNDFHEIIKSLFEGNKIDVIEPAEGTNPSDVLRNHLHRYINEPAAKQYSSFQSGRPLLDDDHAYFLFTSFYDDIKTYEWKESSAKTSLMIRDLFPSKKPEDEAKFDHSKRFPGKDSKSKLFPPLKTLRIPLKYFQKDEDVHETVEFKSEDDII